MFLVGKLIPFSYRPVLVLLTVVSIKFSVWCQHFYHFWGSWVSQWWEHSPPTSVARASNPSVNTICGLSLLFVPSLAPRSFSPGSPVFLVSKTNISKFQFDQQSGGRRTTEWMCYLQILIYFIHSFIYWISPCLLVHLIVFPFLSSPGTEEGKIHKCSKTYSSQFLETYDVSVIAYCFVVMSRLFNCSLWCLSTLVFLFNLVCCSKSSTRPVGSASCRGCLAVTVVLPTWCMENHTSGIDHFFNGLPARATLNQEMSRV